MKAANIIRRGVLLLTVWGMFDHGVGTAAAKEKEAVPTPPLAIEIG